MNTETGAVVWTAPPGEYIGGSLVTPDHKELYVGTFVPLDPSSWRLRHVDLAAGAILKTVEGSYHDFQWDAVGNRFIARKPSPPGLRFSLAIFDRDLTLLSD